MIQLIFQTSESDIILFIAEVNLCKDIREGCSGALCGFSKGLRPFSGHQPHLKGLKLLNDIAPRDQHQIQAAFCHLAL